MTERRVTLAEVKQLLEEASKERELSMEQKFALSHADAFAKLSVEDSEALVEKLMEMEIIHDKLAYKIADLVPETGNEVMALFAKERVVIDKGDIDKILSIVGEFR